MPVGVRHHAARVSRSSRRSRIEAGWVRSIRRVDLRIGADSGLRFEGFAARVTRSNDRWIYSDLVNSAFAILAGIDTRNYFRSNDAEARLFYRIVSQGRSVEPFIGGRFERTTPITAVGNVWAFHGRTRRRADGAPESARRNGRHRITARGSRVRRHIRCGREPSEGRSGAERDHDARDRRPSRNSRSMSASPFQLSRHRASACADTASPRRGMPCPSHAMPISAVPGRCRSSTFSSRAARSCCSSRRATSFPSSA